MMRTKNRQSNKKEQKRNAASQSIAHLFCSVPLLFWKKPNVLSGHFIPDPRLLRQKMGFIFHIRIRSRRQNRLSRSRCQTPDS